MLYVNKSGYMKVSIKEHIVRGFLKWVVEISRKGNEPIYLKKGRVVSANADCIRGSDRSFGRKTIRGCDQKISNQ